MSISEIIIVVIVAILVCSPEDIKLIAGECYKFKKYLLQLKQQIITPIIDELEGVNDLQDKRSLEEMNFYLAKIASLNERYSGQYTLQEVKSYYFQLIKKQHD